MVDMEEMKQSFLNNGWVSEDVKNIVMQKMMEFMEFVNDMEKVRNKMMSEIEFYEKWGDVYED